MYERININAANEGRKVTYTVPSVEKCRDKVLEGLSLALHAHKRDDVDGFIEALRSCSVYAATWKDEERHAI